MPYNDMSEWVLIVAYTIEVGTLALVVFACAWAFTGIKGMIAKKEPKKKVYAIGFASIFTICWLVMCGIAIEGWRETTWKEHKLKEAFYQKNPEIKQEVEDTLTRIKYLRSEANDLEEYIMNLERREMGEKK